MRRHQRRDQTKSQRCGAPTNAPAPRFENGPAPQRWDRGGLKAPERKRDAPGRRSFLTTCLLQRLQEFVEIVVFAVDELVEDRLLELVLGGQGEDLAEAGRLEIPLKG